MDYEGDPRRYRTNKIVSSPSKHSPASTSTLTPNSDTPLTPHFGQPIDFQTISPVSHPPTPAPFFDDHSIQVAHHYGFNTFEELHDLQLPGGSHVDFPSTTAIEGRGFWDQPKQGSSHLWSFDTLVGHIDGDCSYYNPPHSAVTLPSQNGDLVRPAATQLSPTSQPTEERSELRGGRGSGYWSNGMSPQSSAKNSFTAHDIQQWPGEARFSEPMQGMHGRMSLPHLSIEAVERVQESCVEFSDDNDLHFHDRNQNFNSVETENWTDSDHVSSKAMRPDKKKPGNSNNGRGGTKNRSTARNRTPSGSNLSPTNQSSSKVSKSRRASSRGGSQSSPRQGNNQSLSSPLRQETILMSPSQQQLRPFICPLSPYGCQKTFTSKNEWKRHISSQHICLGFWRCDLCTNAMAPNDFNRKDLFTQHVRRMHVVEKATSKQDSTTKKDIFKTRTQHAHCPKKNNPSKGRGVHEHDYQSQAQADFMDTMHIRCWKQVREHPTVLACHFCPPQSTVDVLGAAGNSENYQPGDTFQGPGHYEAWMEHVASHLAASASQARNFTCKEMCAPKESPEVTAAATQSHVDAANAVFMRDTMLRSWLIKEGVIEMNHPNSHGSSQDDDDTDGSSGEGDPDDAVNSSSAAGIWYSLIDRGVASDRAYKRKVSGSDTPLDTPPPFTASLQAHQLKDKSQESKTIGRGPSINTSTMRDSRAEIHSSDEYDFDADGDFDMAPDLY